MGITRAVAEAKGKVMGRAAGFWSYAQEDDEQDGGRIRRLAESVKNEYSLQTGDELDLFVDRDIQWGEAWRERIDSALSATTFFIPVLTPRYFQRPECRRELLTFAGHAKSLGQADLLLPIYYADVHGLRDDNDTSDDAIALVDAMQSVDWRDLRLEDEHASKHRRQVHVLAKRLVDANAAIASREEQQETEVSDPDDEDAPGHLELVAIAEEAMPRFTDVLERIEGELEKLEAIADKWAPSIEQAAAKGAGPALVVFKKVASSFEGPAQEIKSLGIEYAGELVKIDPAVLSMIRMAELSEPDDDSKELFEGIRTLNGAADEALAALRGLVDVLDQTAMLSKDLRKPLRHMRKGLQSILDGQAVIQEWERRASRVEEQWARAGSSSDPSSG